MSIIEANDARIPALGFGTFRMSEAEVAAVLPEALKTGFHHIDTAQAYDNEAAVGAVLKQSGSRRASPPCRRRRGSSASRRASPSSTSP